MSRWPAALLGCVVAAALCGCGSSGARPEPRGPATLDELRWVGKLDRWYHPSNEFAANCSSRFQAQVGSAPSARLDRYAKLTARACRRFERGESFFRKGHDLEARREFEHAGDGMRKVEDALAALRPGTGSLPRRHGPSSKSRIEVRYSRASAAVSSISQVRVRCWSLPDWTRLLHRYRIYSSRPLPKGLMGFTIQPHDINLNPGICSTLDDFTYEHARPTDKAGLTELATALDILAHESQHLNYRRKPEAVVECHAIQSIRGTAELLGASDAYGGKLARAFWRNVYPLELPEYRSPDCHRGGRLDLFHWDQWP